MFKRKEKLRQFAMLRFIGDEEYYPFKKKGVYIYFGEIPNMKGHIIVMDHSNGKLHSGYHPENFEEIPEDET